MDKLKIAATYGIGDTVVFADIAADIDGKTQVKQVQHYVYEEARIQNILDLAGSVTAGLQEFVKPVGEIGSYIDEIFSAIVYSKSMYVFDLRPIPYHGGTTLSSGVLPKWDIQDDIFIKACSLSSSGRWQLDAAHEVYAMDLFRNTGVIVADAVPAYVLFYNADTGQDEVRFCEVTRKFSGNVTYYRDLRNSQKFGLMNDQLIDFVDVFEGTKQGILNMFAADYITNQEDRHAKNFGVLDTGAFSPLYDNGASLNYATPDESLIHVNDEVAMFKALAKNPIEMLKRYSNWFDSQPDINFERVLANLDLIDRRYEGLLSKARLRHNRYMVEGRVAKCRELFS